MPTQNRELVHRGFELFRTGAIDEWAQLVAPDVTWDISTHPLPDFPDRGEGREAFVGHMVEYASGWVNYDVTEVETVESGSDVLELLHERATMRGTDVALDRHIAIVWTVRDGSFSRFRVFRTREEGIAALGG